jgi:hypothetical protein
VTYDKWIADVEHYLVRSGMYPTDAKAAVYENEDWFRAQYDDGAFASITAQDWIDQHGE